ncbi:MAG: ROK family protein [Anaerolineae bacterium]|jgi:glucokinase|nr:ROK family protein [Anaerolineae bacterium]
MAHTADKPVVGVDLGGTKVLAGVVDREYKVLATAKRPTKGETGVDAVVERIAKTVRDAVREAGMDFSDIAGVCSAAPGALNPEDGIVRLAPNIEGWEDIPFAKLLSDQLSGTPVFIENDANLGALGELTLGAAQGVKNMVGIFVGTGIGGGIVLDGKIWRGSHMTAGEIGHVVVLAEGPVCGCGNRGCLESVASRTAIERDIRLGLRTGRESMVPELLKQAGRERMTSGILAQAYEARDPLVYEVITRAQHYLGIFIGSTINYIDPDMIVVGGGVAEALGEAYVEPVRAVAYQYAMNRKDARNVKIVLAKLEDHAALLGAAVYARQRLARRS